MRISAIVIVLVTTSCAQRESLDFMDSCQLTEAWELKDLENERLKFKIKFPATWETKEGFVKGDTVSLTAMDTVEFLKTGNLRILSIVQFGTSIGLDTNFDVILFQEPSYVVNIIARVTKGKDDRLKICDYKQILNTLRLE